MYNQFTARIGNHKPNENTTEKLHIFLVTPRLQEIMLHQAIRMGIADETRATGVKIFTTNLDLIKVFVATSGFGSPRFFYSFILRLGEDNEKTTIYSFSGTKGPLFFEGNAYLYPEDEALTLDELPEETRSWMRATTYRPPQETLKRLVKIEQKDLKQGIRKLMVGE
jgi:hypothetical protein